MDEYCNLKFALHNGSEGPNIFTAAFPKWNLPVTGDHILINRGNTSVIFKVIGKTHVFENGKFSEILYAVMQEDHY